jgi:hypothetical protein
MIPRKIGKWSDRGSFNNHRGFYIMAMSKTSGATKVKKLSGAKKAAPKKAAPKKSAPKKSAPKKAAPKKAAPKKASSVRLSSLQGRRP